MPAESRSEKLPTVIVGAGVAGLTCAKVLAAAGREVLVLEAGERLGGRVRTDRDADGFLLDHGFQVILEAYPALKRHVDLESISIARFDAGASIWTGKRRVPLADPIRHPTAIMRDLSSPIMSFGDKARLARLALQVRGASWQTASKAAGDAESDVSAEIMLAAAGFSRDFFEHFARPFWGGISLDPSLAGSAGPLRFTLKMFLQGSAVLPRDGVQAVPDRLAEGLPAGATQLNQRVERLVIEDSRVVGVEVAGEQVRASSVVVATDPQAARTLTGIESIPTDGVGCVTVFFSGRHDPGVGKRLVLDGTRRLSVNHIAPLSSVQPSYAPAGRHLIAAVLLGDRWLDERDDEKIARAANADVATMLSQPADEWSARRVVRVPFSQFAQPPGIFGGLPDPITPTKSLVLAGEAVVDSSLNGAMTSGERAAAAVLRDASPVGSG